MNKDYIPPAKVRPVVDCSGDTPRTKQQFKDDCDMRKIIQRYRQTGVLPTSNRQAVFGDFSSTNDFRQYVENMMDIEDFFMSLPSGFRKELHNDPANLVDWVKKPENRAQAIEFGLIEVDTPPETPEQPEQPPEAPEEQPE